MKKLNGQFTLIKYSSPGWEKTFGTNEELIAELRSHICHSCRFGEKEYYKEDEDLGLYVDNDPVVDIEYNGIIYECKDIWTLLGTACGCEYGVEIDGRPYYEYRL